MISATSCHPERSAAESKDLLFSDTGAKVKAKAGPSTSLRMTPICRSFFAQDDTDILLCLFSSHPFVGAPIVMARCYLVPWFTVLATVFAVCAVL